MKTIRTIGMTVLSLLLMVGVAIGGVMILPAGHADQVSSDDRVAAKTFSGTIEGIDLMQRVVTIKSEELRGEMQRFAFSNLDVVNGVLKGDRVVVELDKHGMAKKIMKAAPDQKDMSTPKN